MSVTKSTPHVAIVGGGLCGLALAIALEKRHFLYTIYELQSTFSEIGAGLNVAPNAIAAFNLIEPGLGDAVMALGTRNPNPDVWMVNRLGAPTDHFPDAYPIAQIMAPGVGHTAVGRYELLNLLASKIDPARARFSKKLVSIDQDQSAATLHFEDGTSDVADLVVGCDGIHSAVRKCMLGAEHPAAGARFTGIAGYRAVFPMEKLVEALGPEIPRSSCIWSGPGGYVTMYTIEGGEKVNTGLWLNKEEFRERLANERWVLRNQKAALLKDFEQWGPAVQKMMSMMSEETQLWTSHQHDVELDSYFDDRICLIGDAAHSMGPHWGQGASQVMEDAYVMAEVLSQVGSVSTTDNKNLLTQIQAAFAGWQDVRKPQFEWLVKTSHEAFDFWAGFWRSDLTDNGIKRREEEASILLSRIWNANIGRQGEMAKCAMTKVLRTSRTPSSA
ncbi:hypothetical protein TruAng_008594 [Truncatella angustata]|nr:hypothetical protein TruAng_008594 [Truncatella angustata]